MAHEHILPPLEEIIALSTRLRELGNSKHFHAETRRDMRTAADLLRRYMTLLSNLHRDERNHLP
jgi:hypothetical protein